MKVVGEASYGSIGVAKKAKRKSVYAYVKKDVILTCCQCGSEYKESERSLRIYRRNRKFCYECGVKKAKEDKIELAKAMAAIAKRKAENNG